MSIFVLYRTLDVHCDGLCGVFFRCENAIAMISWYGESDLKAFRIAMRWLRTSLVCFVLMCIPCGTVAQTQLSPPIQLEAGRPRLCMPVSKREYGPVQLTPSRVNLMGERYTWLNDTYLAWQATGKPLVGYLAGKLVPTPCGDDTGLYYIVPVLARASQRPIDFAIDLFLLGTLFASAVIGLAGLWAAVQRFWQQVFAVLAIASATYVAFKIGDVYIMQAATVLAIIPWALQLFRNREDSRLRDVFLFVAGIFLGVAQWVRTHSGTGVILFLLVLILAASLGAKRKIILLTVLAVGFAIPLVFSLVILHQRDEYLASVEPNYRPPLSHHVFWHTVYVGLGFLNNPFVPGWHDVVGANTVAEVAPQVVYGSMEYDSILKRRVLQIFYGHPRFIAYTYSAKLGVLLVMLLLATNLGVVASIVYPKGFALELAFWLAMAFGGLTGLIAIPIPQYVIGMIALAILYNYVSLCHAFHCLSSTAAT